MYDITCSIVTYNSNREELKTVLECCLKTKLKIKIEISDNSLKNDLKKMIEELNDARVSYRHNEKNGGYGYGHNKVINDIINKSKYHLILNSDIYFKENTLEMLYDYMEKNKDVGNIMPMVKYPDGEIQFLCKKIPRPMDLFLRKFCPFKSIVDSNNYKYEMRDSGYNKIMNVPILSGCFMFIRNTVFKDVGIFDERYFMYMEDFDLSRRIYLKYRNIFYPNVEIVHNHAKESFSNKKLAIVHIKSAIKYFNKWGWKK